MPPPPIPSTLTESFSSLPLPGAETSSAATAPTAVSSGAFVGDIQELLQWDTSLTQPALVLSNGNKTAKRPGSVSCYPAALIPVPLDKKYSLSVGL